MAKHLWICASYITISGYICFTLLLYVSANFGCYYPGSSHLYDGTKSTTWNGKKCQRWDAQSPHDHSFDLTYDFPDASLTAAENYCRNPDYDGDEPWCYTTDPNERYTTCAVPKC
jgi:hypothetical protein